MIRKVGGDMISGEGALLMTAVTTAHESTTTLAAATETGGWVTEWVVSIMEALGGPGAGIIVALENVFPPIPSEVILPMAGFAASMGTIGMISAIVWTTIGSVVGAAVLYYFGALVGLERTRALAERIPLIDAADIDKTDQWFARHGTKAVFFGRMVPGIRSLISIPAGVQRMRLGVFLALTTAGSLIWNSALIVAGYFLGANWSAVEHYLGMVQTGVIAVIAVAVTAFVAMRVRPRRQTKHEQQGERSEHDGSRTPQRSTSGY